MAPFKHKTGSRQVSTQTWRGVLPIHPAAKLLPHMADDELRELGEDIRRHGQRIPITILTDQDGTDRLLDGRNRLDAMERAGLPIVKDGELNREQVDIQNLAGNVDPFAYVLSANLHRRHLTSDQKRDVIVAVLKARPSQSDRAIGKQVNVDHKTVGAVREKLESRGEIPHTETRTDTKGREQPAKKTRKPKAEPEPMTPAVAAAETETPIAPAEAEQEESDDSRSLAWSLQTTFNDVWEECQETKNWCHLSAARKARLKRAMTKLRAAFLELIDLAKPVKRGRPRKVTDLSRLRGGS
jgi:ParB-like chromosome segregation protein Spo0J